MPPSPRYPCTPPACQVPSGSPAGSCQALGPFPWPSPPRGRSLKATSFPHASLSVCSLFSPAFSALPNASASSQKHLCLLLSLSNLFGPFVTNSSIWALPRLHGFSPRSLAPCFPRHFSRSSSASSLPLLSSSLEDAHSSVFSTFSSYRVISGHQAHNLFPSGLFK